MNQEEIDAFIETLESYKQQGVIDYYILSNPIGESWVVGYDNKILTMPGASVFYFLAGCGAVARMLAKRSGVVPR